jgi:N-acetylglutamate synthase-like GNAT family acetyltransferase
MEQTRMAEQWSRDGFRVTTDPNALDIEVVHAFLHQAYWSKGIPLAVLQRALAHSLNFSLLRDEQQIGFARVVTDYATFAYVADVFVLPDFRAQGLATWMMTCILEHPHLQGLRRWCLATRDAHQLYAKVGFQRTSTPERWMEKLDPEVYQRRDERPGRS